MAILLYVLAGVATLLGLLALPTGGLFFALPYLLFIMAVLLAILSGFHLLTARGFRTHASWRWIAKATPVILLLLVFLAFWSW